MKEKVKKSIDEILKNFDYERVQKVMNFLDWKWSTSSKEIMTPKGKKTVWDSYIPTIEQLKERSKELIVDTYKVLKSGRKRYTVSTGGFKVTGSKHKKEYFFELEFVLEEWDNYK